MSDAAPASRPAQDFEQELGKAAAAVAAFDTHDRTLLHKAQHFLHANPAAIPLIVLIVSILAFGLIVGSRFFSAFTMTLILQQVAIDQWIRKVSG